ncbi:MAG: biotin--[acetyl-CoA-carboxylase] ligase, partial [Desulfohalobiaceae bacterium]
GAIAMHIYSLAHLLPAGQGIVEAADPKNPWPFGRFWKDFRIAVHPSCNSSLDLAWQLEKQGRFLPGDSVLCLEQSSGRGRMRRQWASPAGNIYAALRLAEPEDASAGELLSLLVAYCLLQALRRKRIQVQLKWPNDLLLEGRKIAGLLIEHKPGAVIAGIGINLQVAPRLEQTRDSRLVPPGDLRQVWPEAEPLQAWAELLYWTHLWYVHTIADFSVSGFVSEVRSYLWLLHRKVTVQTPSRAVCGYLLGLDAKGGLILDCKGRPEHINSGSIYAKFPVDETSQGRNTKHES